MTPIKDILTFIFKALTDKGNCVTWLKVDEDNKLLLCADALYQKALSILSIPVILPKLFLLCNSYDPPIVIA